MSEIPEGFATSPVFDPAEDHVGPFYYQCEGDNYHCVFLAESRHCNAQGIIHGGVLMTFADYALCLAAAGGYAEESCTTVSFSAEFVSGAEVGYLIECTPKVVRKTGSLVFVTGELTRGEQILLVFNSAVKRIRKQ